MTASSVQLSLLAVPGMPLIQAGDHLAGIVLACLEAAGLALQGGDIVVVAQKIVSKAEGRQRRLADVAVSDQARALAAQTGKDPRMVALVLSQSRRVVRAAPGVLIVQLPGGLTMANAGIDQSNVAGAETDDEALLLPLDADASAARLRAAWGARTGVHPGVIVSDSFGRPWRRGTVGVAIGAAGVPSLLDLRGQADLFGRALRITEVGLADEIASAASLLMGQSGEGRPVVIVRGLALAGAERPASDLIRPAAEDLFA